MGEYTAETDRRLDKLRETDEAAYVQLMYGPAIRLREHDMAAQLDMYEEENGVTL